MLETVRLFLIFIGFYVVTYAFGYPVKVLLLNEALKKYDLYITPIIGLSLMGILLVLLSRIGFAVDTVAYFLLAAILALDIFLAATKREIPAFANEWKIMAPFFVLACAFFAVPLVISGYRTLMLNNGDFFNYVQLSKFASDFSILNLPDSFANLPPYGVIKDAMDGNQLRSGSFVVAFLGKIFSLDDIEGTYLFMCFLITSIPRAIRPFIKAKKYIVLIFMATVLFNSSFLLLLDWGMQGHLFTLSMVVTSFFFAKFIIEENKFDIKMMFIMALLMTFIGECHPESFPYLWVTYAVYGAYALFKREIRINYLKNFILLAILIALIDFRVYLSTFNAFMSITSNNGAWQIDVQTGSLPYMIGIYNYLFYPMPDFVLILLNVIIGFLIAVYLYRSKLLVSYYSLSLIVLMAMYIVFVFIFEEYFAYKFATTIAFIPTILFMRSVILLVENESGPLKTIGLGMLILTFALSVNSGINNVLYIMHDNNSLELSDSYKDIEPWLANEASEDRNIFIENRNGFLRLAEYFSSYRGITIPETSGQYVGENPQVNDLYISEPDHPEIFASNSTFLFNNDYYIVKQIESDTCIYWGNQGLAPLRKLGGSPDSVHYVDTCRLITENEAEIEFYSLSNQELPLSVELFIEKAEPYGVQILLNGQIISEARFDANTPYTQLNVDKASLREGINIIRFQTDIPNKINISKISLGSPSILEPKEIGYNLYRSALLTHFYDPISYLITPKTNEPFSLASEKAVVEVSDYGFEKQGESLKLKMEVKNDGAETWSAYGKHPILLYIYIYDEAGGAVYGENINFIKASVLKPGKSKNINHVIDMDKLNLPHGNYTITFSVGQHMVGFLQAMETLNIEVGTDSMYIVPKINDVIGLYGDGWSGKDIVIENFSGEALALEIVPWTFQKHDQNSIGLYIDDNFIETIPFDSSTSVIDLSDRVREFQNSDIRLEIENCFVPSEDTPPSEDNRELGIYASIKFESEEKEESIPAPESPPVTGIYSDGWSEKDIIIEGFQSETLVLEISSLTFIKHAQNNINLYIDNNFIEAIPFDGSVSVIDLSDRVREFQNSDIRLEIENCFVPSEDLPPSEDIRTLGIHILSVNMDPS